MEPLHFEHRGTKKVGKGAVKVGVDVVTGVIVQTLEHYAKGA